MACKLLIVNVVKYNRLQYMRVKHHLEIVPLRKFFTNVA